MIGKWHLWSHRAGGHAGAANNFVPPGPYRLGFDDFWAAYNFGHDNYHYSYWTDSPRELHGKEFKPVHFTDLAIGRIKRHAQAGEPFAMVVAYSPPHDPWGRNNVPKEWYDKFAGGEVSPARNLAGRTGSLYGPQHRQGGVADEMEAAPAGHDAGLLRPDCRARRTDRPACWRPSRRPDRRTIRLSSSSPIMARCLALTAGFSK